MAQQWHFQMDNTEQKIESLYAENVAFRRCVAAYENYVKILERTLVNGRRALDAQSRSAKKTKKTLTEAIKPSVVCCMLIDEEKHVCCLLIDEEKHGHNC
jgi:hypothetical protein